MNKILQIYSALTEKKWVCFLAGTAMGVLIWTFSSNAVQDIIVFSAFLYALFYTCRGLPAWKQPAGIAFVVLLIHHLASLPFSVSPEMSIRDTEGIIEILAGAFAIPIIFNTDRKISRALLYSAVGITLTLGYDLIRMTYYLGPDIFARAHSFRPFILNHSNVASMMAGLSFFVLLYFMWQERRSFLPFLACLAGSIICLAYLIIAASRGPQIAFALAFAFSGLILPGWKRKLIWLVLVIALGVVLLINFNHVNPRFAEKSTMQNFSERDKVWKHTWQMVKERPWFGHGYGKRNFETNYYASHPPLAKYHFPHCHEYWLKLLFEYGWFGFGLYAAAWLILAVSLLRRIFTARTFDERFLPGVIALMLLFIHLYGLGDYPDNIVQTAQIWLIPAALVAISSQRSEVRDQRSEVRITGAKMQSVIRAFIAVEINEDIRVGLEKIQHEFMKTNAHVSWIKPQNIHCTLVFLGDIFTDTVDPLTTALNQATAGCKPFEVEIAGLGYFGSARSPRIIWAGMAGRTDTLIELQGKITAAVLQAGLKPDLKPFKPHLTIGRVRSNRNAAKLVHALEKNRDKSFGVLAVKQVVLMESRLSPTGPTYFPLCSVALGG